MTLALGFAPDAPGALAAARASLRAGFDARRPPLPRRLARLPRRPARGRAAPPGHERLYDVSLMVMAALEDKTYRGAGIASPSMAWVWGQIAGYSGPYHLVWSRDLYQVATAQIAAGDRAAAGRALDHLCELQQQPDGCFPQNANLDGTPHWPNLQLDEVADPILLAVAARARPTPTTWSHVRRAAECILDARPGHPGALGERGRLLARHDRRRDRRARLPRPRSPSATGRPPTPRATARSPTTGGARLRRVDGDDERAALAGRRTSCGSASTGTPTRGTTYDARRRRPDDRPARRRRPELPRAGAARRAARRRRGRALDAAGRRPRARRRHAERPLLAPLLARRLRRDRRDGGPFGTGPNANQASAGRGRSSPASAASTSSRAGELSGDARGARAAARVRLDAIAATAERRADAARAGVGRPAAGGRARLRARHRDRLGDAARLDARAVRPAGVVDRRGPAGGAAGGR